MLGAQPFAPAAADSCSVAAISHYPLVLANDDEIYVAPETFAANPNGDILLAGTPNYIFARRDDGTGVLMGRDSLFGAIITAAGGVSAIPPPLDPRLVTGVRALARTDGSWSLVFGERAHARHDHARTSDERIVALWHGVIEGTHWSSLEKLAIPPDVVLSTAGVSFSPLRQHDDRLAWAVGARLSSGVEGVLVLERQGGRWSSRTVNTRSAVLGGLTYSDSGTLLLAVIAADTAIAPGESDRNSLFVWSSDGDGWRRVRRLVHGGADGAVLSSSLDRWGSIPISTWVAEAGDGYQLRTVVDVVDGEHVTTIAEDLTQFYTYSSTAPANGSYLWVTLHGHPPEPQRLRFHRVTSAGAMQVAETESPVLNGFRITSGEREEILLTGALEVKEAGTVVSVVVKYRLDCR
jgi:hypothetical protein